MKNNITGYLFILLCLASACQDKTKPTQQGAFHYLSLYFESEIQTLKKSQRSLTKNLFHNGKNETIRVASPDWEKELSPFTESVSSQPRQVQAFDTDSILTGPSKIVRYTALDVSATIKSLSVYFTGTTPDSVIIIKLVSNSYYASSDTLKYFGGGNYRIRAENQPGFGKKLGFLLEGITEPAN
jgi:hypothetical protein